MALLTPLDAGSARSLGEAYGLRVVSATGLRAGSVNSNFALELEGGGRAFLRIYEEQPAESAAKEARLVAQLAGAGIPTPRPMPVVSPVDDSSEGTAFLTTHAGKPVAVFPWVDGRASCQRAVSAARLRTLGAALAALHHVGDRALCSPTERFSPRALLGRIAAARRHERATDDVLAACDDLEARLAAELQRSPTLDAVIHGDLFRDNVLWDAAVDDSLAALLDFESASLGSALFDLGVTLLAWCYGDELDLDLARALVDGYTSRRPIDRHAAEALYVETRFAAIRFATTRITDFELRPAGQGVYKDFRRFLGRLAAVEALGPSGFRSIIASD